MRKQIIIGTAIFAALLGYVLLTQSGNRSFSTIKLPELALVPAGDIERIELNRPSGRFVIAKRQNEWFIIEPFLFKADKYKSENLQRLVAEVKLTDLIAEGRDTDADYGLTSLTAQSLLVQGPKGKEWKLVLGKAHPDLAHTFVRLPDRDAVYLATGDLVSALPIDPKEWRGLQIYEQNTDAVQSVTISQGDKEFTLAKVPENPGNTASARRVWKAGDVLLDDAKVNAFLSGLTRLSAVKIVETSGAAAKPVAVLRWKTLDAEHFLEILEHRKKEKTYWVRRGGETGVYEITEAQGQNLLKSEKDLKP